MKKPLKKQFQLSEKTLRTALYIMVGQSFDEMVKDLKKLGLEFEIQDKFRNNDGISWPLISNGARYNVLWIKTWDGGIRSHGVLAHELLHFALDEMDNKGIEVKAGHANETVCYLYEYYFTEILKRLW